MRYACLGCRLLVGLGRNVRSAVCRRTYSPIEGNGCPVFRWVCRRDGAQDSLRLEWPGPPCNFTAEFPCRCLEWTARMSEVLCTPGDLLLAHHISTVR